MVRFAPLKLPHLCSNVYTGVSSSRDVREHRDPPSLQASLRRPDTAPHLVEDQNNFGVSGTVLLILELELERSTTVQPILKFFQVFILLLRIRTDVSRISWKSRR